MKASEELLDKLHALMAESMTEELAENFRRSKLPRSHDDYEPLNIKLIQAARQFLKDNGVDTPEQAKRFDGLVKQLGDIDFTPSRYGRS